MAHKKLDDNGHDVPRTPDGFAFDGVPHAIEGAADSLADRLRQVHLGLRDEARFKALERMAIALYDPKTDTLKTFIHSSGDANPLPHYTAKLSDAHALHEYFLKGEPRVVNDLSIYYGENAEHTRRLREEGYRSSYTVPMYHRGRFFGFIFFNSRKPGFFTQTVTHHLLVHAELIALLLIFEFRAMETLQAAVSTVREIGAHRDSGTGQHLDRMSRFAQVVALELASEKELSDEYIEYLFQFAPLHDIGKVAIPDSILLSARSLVDEEVTVMRSHVDKGVQIIDHMIKSFSLESLHYTEILRNIVASHHEAWDGSGYPLGLRGEEIPLEARIVSLADVFDALTSRRSYKQAWSVDEAISFVAQGAGITFDAACVAALRRARPVLEEIQARFREDTFG